MKSKKNNQNAGGKLPNLSNKTRSKLLSRFMKEKFSKKKAKELADSITKEYGGLSVLKHQYPFLSEENNTRGEEKKNNNSGNNSGGRRKKSLKKKSKKKRRIIIVVITVEKKRRIIIVVITVEVDAKKV